MKAKRITSLILALALALSLCLTGCGSQGGDTQEPAGENTGSDDAKYTVGICQLVQHDALDAAAQGFIDALNEALPGQVKIVEKNASGDSVNCSTIVNGFVSDGVDLIMANATPALTAAASATSDIPILGTSITAYGVALDMDDFNGTVNAKTALDGLSLTLWDGEFVTVIGGNGAGKSTMLNAAASTLSVDSGEVHLDGVDVTDLPEYKRAAYIGRVFQDPMMGTAPSMHIEENLALAARRGQKRGLRWGITKAERERYRALLGDLGLGLETRLSSEVSTLSGGQRQALTLLMATLKSPKLLLDEHTAALDPKTAAKVMALTDRIVTKEKLTTLMITHNMRNAIQYGSRLVMLHEGRVILDISGEEKKNLTVSDLLAQFARVSGDEFASDRALLS